MSAHDDQLSSDSEIPMEPRADSVHRISAQDSALGSYEWVAPVQYQRRAWKRQPICA